MAHQSATSQVIIEIFTQSGLSIDQKEINGQFKHFYSTIYTSESPADPSLIDIFFENLNVSTINPQSKACLDRMK